MKVKITNLVGLGMVWDPKQKTLTLPKDDAYTVIHTKKEAEKIIASFPLPQRRLFSIRKAVK